MNIDPDVAVMIEALEARIAELESANVDGAEARASIDFNAALFSVLQSSNDRAAVWSDLAAYLRSR